jgi:hypothetical protein
MATLERELETYKKALPTLLDKQGKYVLIKGDAVAGVWGTYEDAIQEGYRLFKLEPFLVKQIQAMIGDGWRRWAALFVM